MGYRVNGRKRASVGQAAHTVPRIEAFLSVHVESLRDVWISTLDGHRTLSRTTLVGCTLHSLATRMSRS